ncbi:TetR family transcriptional regulator [Streptomyces monomycini]
MPYVPADTRREQVVEAAVQVIAREGADGATTRKIADEARAPLASLHHRFRNEENLLSRRLHTSRRRDACHG